MKKSFDIYEWNKKRYLGEISITEESSKYDAYLNVVIEFLKDDIKGGDEIAVILERYRNFITRNMQSGDLKFESQDHDYDRYKDLGKQLEKTIKSLPGGNNAFVSMGHYTEDRPDSDPKKGKGYGSITFSQQGELQDADWNKILQYLKSQNFEITSESNYYDFEPGEREWFPKIKFEFNTSEIDGVNELVNKD